MKTVVSFQNKQIVNYDWKYSLVLLVSFEYISYQDIIFSFVVFLHSVSIIFSFLEIVFM